MAKRRRSSSRRSRRTRRRVAFVRRRRPRGGLRQPVQYFKRVQYIPSWHQINAGNPGTGQALNFSLSQVPNASEFTLLYDQYQIKGVKVHVIPKFTETAIGKFQGNMWSVLDYDDATVPTALSPLLQYQNVKRTRMQKMHKRYIRPCVATEIFNTGITTTYSPKRNVWIDCASDTTEHYGMKLWFDGLNSDTVIWDLQLTYYLAFKNVR